MAIERFEFAFDARFSAMLLPLGITPRTAYVELDGRRMRARFGVWVAETTIGNIESARMTGPFKWYKVVGPHVSLADRGLTFGTNAAKAVCLTFTRPVRGAEPLGVLRHPGLTLTLTDPEAFVAALRARGAKVRAA